MNNVKDLSNLEVNHLVDYDTDMLKEAINFEKNIFGDLGMNEWGIVPQIRHGNVYVLKEPGKSKDIIGLAIMMRDWDDLGEVYLFDFGIKTKYQNKGLGTEFLQIISNHLRNNDFDKISLTVDPDNGSAVHVYKNKLGFRIKKKSKHEYGENVERYIMKLDLNN